MTPIVTITKHAVARAIERNLFGTIVDADVRKALTEVANKAVRKKAVKALEIGESVRVTKCGAVLTVLCVDIGAYSIVTCFHPKECSEKSPDNARNRGHRKKMLEFKRRKSGWHGQDFTFGRGQRRRG